SGQSRVLGLEGVPIHYLDRYAFSQRASSLMCKCTLAAGKPPSTTMKPEKESGEYSISYRFSEPVAVPDSVSEGASSVDIPVPKEGGPGEAESGYGSEREPEPEKSHLEEVKSLEDMGTGEEKEEKKEEKEGQEKEDSEED
ncbi:hypothetical protein PENTCL1PPCAC_8892, partial [Pristionchus entomophagus]